MWAPTFCFCISHYLSSFDFQQFLEPSNAELNTNKKTELHDESATQTKSLQNYIIFQLEGCNCTRKLLVNHSSKATNSDNSGINGI